MGAYTVLLIMFFIGFIAAEWWICIFAVVAALLFALIDYTLERNDDDEYL